MSDQRTITLMRLDELQPDPRNPKAHDVGTIEQSVSRFGYVEPVIIDGRTGYIISGHGRTKTLRAMRDSGEQPPEGVIVDDDAWLVPVVAGWSSRSDSEAAAALVALNRTTELGGWVDDALLDLLDDLDELNGVGYTDDDIEQLRTRLADVEFNPTDDDDRLDVLDPKPCPACGYDIANDPEQLRKR